MAQRLTTIQDVTQLGTILGVWAHPDDESFMMAGLMAMAINNGQTVVCITATKGELGVQNESKWPADRLGEIRAAELATAFQILRVKHHHWLGYVDGSCNKQDEREALAHISHYLHQYKPDTVITFPPDGSTGHPDHVTVSKWAQKAVIDSLPTANLYYAVDLTEQYEAYMKELDEKFNIYFNIDRPKQVPSAECDILLKLDSSTASLKCDALMAMPSQTEIMFNEVGKPRMCRALGMEGFVLASKNREWGRPRQVK